MGSASAASLEFLGAAGTVTGSKHLVRLGDRSVLLDCGLFQGLKALRLRNWAPPRFDPRKIDAVVLSHAHLDHSGYLPLVVREGFRGPIFSSAATADVARILLLDSAHLQEDDAERANRRGYSKHRPALPLYTTEDAEAALGLFVPMDRHRPFDVAAGMRATLRDAGHILGASIIELELATGPRPTRVVFSGDLGRWNRPLVPDPELVSSADVLLCESTYGDRHHAAGVEERLAELVRETASGRRVLLVPAFAVGRTQELLYMIRKLEDAGRIPRLPVFVDSPMAIEVTGIYRRHLAMHRDAVEDDPAAMLPAHARLLPSAEESKSLNDQPGPMILVSASGMATGGRILHHLHRHLGEPSTTVLLVGFQAAGTRGRALQDGATSVRIHGDDVPVRARVTVLDGLSAHADRTDLLRWARGFATPPRRTFVVHGEPQPADSFAALLRIDLRWRAEVAEDGARIPLAGA